MFCPKCKDEFRHGFTRCAGCDVDLVEDLSLAGSDPGAVDSACAAAACAPMIEYCGFLDLEEARMARDRLRRELIRSEILIREAADSTMDRSIKEEYWLRVEHKRFRTCSEILGYDHVESGPDASFNCSNCGNLVSEHESACPKCGARFEDD
jgi:rubrerythrin